MGLLEAAEYLTLRLEEKKLLQQQQQRQAQDNEKRLIEAAQREAVERYNRIARGLP